VNLAALDLDTSRLDLTGSGTLNLAAETMALRLRPTVRVGGTGILAPVKIEGSFAHPAAALDSQGVEGRAGIVIGGAAPPDTCPAALTLARDGRAGRMPAPAVVKAPKAADLLRSFLR
jgi:AsmA protein